MLELEQQHKYQVAHWDDTDGRIACPIDSQPEANHFRWSLVPLSRLVDFNPANQSGHLSELLGMARVGSIPSWLDNVTILGETTSKQLDELNDGRAAKSIGESGLLFCTAMNALGWLDGHCLSATIVGNQGKCAHTHIGYIGYIALHS